MDDRGRRWAFLRPWCAVLRGLPLFCRLTKYRAVLSFELQKESTPAKLSAIRNALILLSLLARVDIWALSLVIEGHCGGAAMASVEMSKFEGLHSVSIEVIVEESEQDLSAVDSTVEVIRCLLQGPSITPQNPHLLGMAAKKIALLGGVNWSGERLDIRVELGTGWNGKCESTRWWRSVQALQDSFGGSRFAVAEVRSASGLDCAFTLGPTHPTVAGNALDEDLVALIERMMNESGTTAFSGIEIWRRSVEEGDREPNAIRLWGRLHSTITGAGSSSSDKRPEIKFVGLDSYHAGSADIVRACSAFADAQTARKLKLTLDRLETESAQRSLVWTWVAFALFSDYATRRSSITGVKLSVEFLTEADVDAVADLLSSPDPIGLLVQADEAVVSRVSREADDPGVLKRGAWVTLLPMDSHDDFPPESSSWELSQDIHGIIVVDTVTSSPELVRAIVPGYGLCQVRRVDVVPDTDAPRSSGPVTSLKLDDSALQETGAALERLLELVGLPLTHLQLALWYDRTIPIAAIMRCCPKLERLVLRRSAIDASIFLDAYRTSNLRMRNVEFSVTNFVALFTELSDGETRLAKTLKRLDCTLEGASLPLDPADLRAIIAMLKRNRTLEYVFIRVDSDADESVGIKELERFDHELLPFASEPFPLRCRLAFLSVFSPPQRADRNVKRRTWSSDTPKLALLAIDRLVLSLIFEFAAPSAVRRVRVTPVED